MTNQVQKTVTSKELIAKILIDSFETDEKEMREYLAIRLPDPFGDEDFVNVAIAPKWEDDESVFKYYAKKALRTEPEIEFPVTLKVLEYKNKKKNKTVRYAGLIGISPFNGRELEFRIKSKEKAAVFTELAGKLLGLDISQSSEVDE